MEVHVMLTMDCEPARIDVTEYARGLSDSGPLDYEAGRASMRAYVDIAEEFGFTPTLFVHPEVAEALPDFLRELESDGVCLGLHVHPYKLDEQYRHDLGAYPAAVQREILEQASSRWTRAIGHGPRYFRGGRYSANDNTFAVLHELGFEGGSLSNVGRIWPAGCAVWAGAEPYPHRAHEGFRQLAGESDFVEVPTLGDETRPFDSTGAAGEMDGYEWLYVPSTAYDHPDITQNLLDRFQRDRPAHPVLVTNTHNDMPYEDPDHVATRNLRTILETAQTVAAEADIDLLDSTVGSIVELVRAETS